MGIKMLARRAAQYIANDVIRPKVFFPVFLLYLISCTAADDSPNVPGDSASSHQGTPVQALVDTPLAHEPVASVDTAPTPVLLDADGFPNIPEVIKNALLAGNCAVPQVPFIQAPHNVISGSFVESGQRHWAALCSDGERSTIRVFSQGGEMVAEFAERGDVFSFEDLGRRRSFYRRIEPISASMIASNCAAGATATSTPPNHQGIDDQTVDLMSKVYYYNGRTWDINCGGAD